MTDRQRQLLTFLIESYIATAEPIGSKFVVEEGGFDVSGATVRNELRDLEERGYLTHPHTSAGRVPTEKGYQLYVRELMRPAKLRTIEQGCIDRITADDADTRLKQFAKETVDIVNAAVIISFDAERVYYTGMSALFSQPEFQNVVETIKMGEVFDHIEDRIPTLMELFGDTVHTYIGSEHPLGSATSIVGRRIGQHGMILYLAPIRMRYDKAIACLSHIRTLI